MEAKIILFLPVLLGLICSDMKAMAQSVEPSRFILEKDSAVRKEEPGTHNGGGQTIGYSFFDAAPGLKTAFKKRVLLPGSAIGYHLQKADEIYYIVSGTGLMKMNGEIFKVKPGDAILTRPGSWHGLAPETGQTLTLFIIYEKQPFK